MVRANIGGTKQILHRPGCFQSNARNTPWNLCKRCLGNRLGDNFSGDFVCFDCGLVQGASDYQDAPEFAYFKEKTYKRIFYFNERCSRWMCDEPKIDEDTWRLIYSAATNYVQKKRRNASSLTREDVNKILRSVEITPEFALKKKSQKFKCTLMTKKRFYDKYSEKWKMIIWKLTGDMPVFPSKELVDKMKHLFLACQKPFNLYRHEPCCDGRYRCDHWFQCWHNFINYDFIFRKLLQVCELKFGFKNVYKLFKDDFILVGKKIRDDKLRPMFRKIAEYNQWPCPEDE